jgi:Xaa-Pro dipeptidase
MSDGARHPPDDRALVPRLSLTERDRRHGEVRRRMADAKLDVLILPASTARWEQNMADSRYLTSIGGFGTEALTIFPREAAATCYVFNRADFWRRAQDWVTDVRDGRNFWLDNIRERLSEIGFRTGRIGIAGLAGLTRTPDGIVPYATVAGLEKTYPGVEIVNATDLMREVRSIKSEEELALITQATAMAEAMVGTLAALKPGDTERTLYAGMVRMLVERGGDLPAMILIGSGPALSHGSFVPTDRKLLADDLIVGEVEGRFAGYSGQIVRPAVLGSPDPAYGTLVSVATDVFYDVLAAMKPGVSLGAVMSAYETAINRRGGGTCKGAFPLMHARGLGDEYPAVLSSDDRRRLDDYGLQPGMVFVLKPRVARPGLPVAQIGDMVVVGNDGASRLGRERLGLTELSWRGD